MSHLHDGLYRCRMLYSLHVSVPANMLCTLSKTMSSGHPTAFTAVYKLLYVSWCLQHPSGYEASLDPWLQQLWIALRLKCPLPLGVQQVGVSLDSCGRLIVGKAGTIVCRASCCWEHPSAICGKGWANCPVLWVVTLTVAAWLSTCSESCLCRAKDLNLIFTHLECCVAE